MRNTLFPCVAFAVSLLATSLPAQIAQQSSSQQTPRDFWGNVELARFNTIDWPAGLGNGDFKSVDAGRITGRERTSLVVLKGSQAFLVYEPAQCVAVVSISSTDFTAVGILPEPQAGALDGVIGATTTGLTRVGFDAGTRTFQETPIGGAHWARAARVRAAQINHTRASFEVIGLSQGGSSLLIGEWDRASGVLLNEEVHPITGDNGIDVVAVDWDYDGQNECGILNDRGLVILDDEGVEVGFVRSIHPGGGIAVLPDPNQGRPFLAWSTPAPAGTHFLHLALNSLNLVGPDHLLFTPPTGGAPAGIPIYGLGAGDWDGDGDHDVLLSHEGYMRSYVLNNDDQSGLPGFDPSGDYLTHDLSPTPGASALGNRARQLFTNIDRDPLSTDDLIYALDSTNGIVIERGESERIAFQGGTIPPPVWKYLDAASHLQLDTSGSTVTAQLKLVLNDVAPPLLDFEYFQVVVWKQNDPITTGGSPTEPVALSNELFSVTPHPAGGEWPYHWVDVTIPMDSFVWPQHEHFYVAFRFVDAYDSGGVMVITESSQPLLAGLTMPDTAQAYPPYEPHPSYAYLKAKKDGPFITLLDSDPPTFGGGGFLFGNAAVGAIVPQGTIPPFGAGILPDPTAIGTGGGLSTHLWD